MDVNVCSTKYLPHLGLRGIKVTVELSVNDILRLSKGLLLVRCCAKDDVLRVPLVFAPTFLDRQNSKRTNFMSRPQ